MSTYRLLQVAFAVILFAAIVARSTFVTHNAWPVAIAVAALVAVHDPRIRRLPFRGRA